MNDDLAKELIDRQMKLSAQRSSWEVRWQEVAELVVPQLATFQGNRTQAPDRQTGRIFDSTATWALERFAAAMESLLTPSTKKWHALKPSDRALRSNYRVRRYLDDQKDNLFAWRYAPRSGFSGNIGELYGSLGAFGTAPMLVEEDLGRGIRYQSLHLQETFLTTSANGVLDGVYRKYCYTARQALQRFGEATPEKIKEAIDARQSQKEYEFLHVVLPNEERVLGAPGVRGMAYKSFYVFVPDKTLIGEGGYRTMPYVAPRYKVAGGTPYGWGPCLMVLPEIKTANRIRYTMLRQGELAADPPVLLPAESLVVQPFNVRPGANNYGMVSPEGRQLALPYQGGARFDVAQEELAGCRKLINDALLASLFQFVLDDTAPVQTATWVLERAKEKGILLAPAMGRQQNEGLAPMIGRELDILSAAGVGGEMPPELAESGGTVTVEYESDLAQLQRAGESVGLARFLEVMTPIIQLKPEVLDVLEEDETARNVADVSGLPYRMIRSPEAMAGLRQARAEAQQAAQQQEAMPGMASAERNMAMAEKTRASFS